jgi:hypothetical protein
MLKVLNLYIIVLYCSGTEPHPFVLNRSFYSTTPTHLSVKELWIRSNKPQPTQYSDLASCTCRHFRHFRGRFGFCYPSRYCNLFCSSAGSSNGLCNRDCLITTASCSKEGGERRSKLATKLGSGTTYNTNCSKRKSLRTITVYANWIQISLRHRGCDTPTHIQLWTWSQMRRY